MRAVLRRVTAVAGTSLSVVITGETGTGKEVIARLLHANSDRSAGKFVALNVAALPSELLESELFGHVQGAFTGATTSTTGVFAAADGGTLFLDEIGEMPLALQAKLLRAVQEGEIRRVGDTKTIAVDVRIVCATHRDLRAAVAAGRFRQDLYYRLKVFGIAIPPLRSRVQDVLPLAHMFANQLGSPAPLQFNAARKSMRPNHTWPGKVRELGNVIEHALALSRGEVITPEHFPDDLADATTLDGEPMTLADAERAHILKTLDACGGNQVEAARVLAIGRNTLWRKVRSYSRA